MKIIARHKWVEGATITESIDKNNPTFRRFTATIRGFQKWKVFEGIITTTTAKEVFEVVRGIRDRIDSGDDSVFDDVPAVPT